MQTDVRLLDRLPWPGEPTRQPGYPQAMESGAVCTEACELGTATNLRRIGRVAHDGRSRDRCASSGFSLCNLLSDPTDSAASRTQLGQRGVDAA